MLNLLSQLNEDIDNIFKYGIETTKAYTVPSRDDSGLTFPIGDNKKGKLIETCVLFVDIRNSTIISRSLKRDKILLGKIYSAFIHAMTTIADEYGYVRNIIGDRVMVVFEPKDCIENAIKCSALMFTVAREIISIYCKPTIFKVGIGIDYGEMLILKTGIRKRHEEQSEYKNLVWIGDTANIASKLTDFSGKEISQNLYKLTFHSNIFPPVKKYPVSIFDNILKKDEKESNYLTNLYNALQETHGTVDSINLYQNLVIKEEGIFYQNKKIKSIHQEKNPILTSPVLMSGNVYRRFKKSFPDSQLLRRFSNRTYPSQPNTGSGIYGGWFLIKELLTNYK